MYSLIPWLFKGSILIIIGQQLLVGFQFVGIPCFACSGTNCTRFVPTQQLRRKRFILFQLLMESKTLVDHDSRKNGSRWS